jgi:NAD(P)-dependent dehydrogenase (short-subunit alcohol dehydrogenase family)
MDLELSGKTALVTGASRGIGHVIAEVLHEEGCRVALNGRNESDLTSAVTELSGAIAIAGDVTLPEEAARVVSEAIDEFDGHLDILVCNVGEGSSVAPGTETHQEWQRVFAMNLWSTTNMVEAARQTLSLSKGVVVCISSICGLEVIFGAPVTYSAAKAALNAYVRGIARPLGEVGIRINAVAPGNIFFEHSTWAHKLSENPDGVKSLLEKEVALGRLGTARDVAELVAYLASGRASFATGGVWTIDGGQVRS